MAWKKKANLIGPSGAAGPSAELRIGSVMPGWEASATLSGASPNQTLDLVLPRGAQGLPGAGSLPADAAVAGYIGTLGESATKTALKASFVGKGQIVANVRDFGAVGDGVADETSAIQAAMDYIGTAGGGTLLFPPGEYFVLGTVVLVSNVRITGPGAVIRKKAPSTNYVVFVGLAKNVLGYSGGVTNVVCEDICFRGDLPNGYAIGAFALHRAGNIRFRKVQFLEVVRGGHVIDLQGCENVIVDECEFAGSRPTVGRAYTEAIQLDSSVANGFGFPEQFWAEEVCDGTASRNITVKNSDFRPITVGDVTYLTPPPLGAHSYVEGNYYRNINFLNNTVGAVVQPEASDGYKGILHFVAVQDLTISGNTFDNGGQLNFGVIVYRGIQVIPMSRINDVYAATTSTTNPSTALGVRVSRNTFTGFTSADTGYHVISIVGDSAGTKVAEDVRIDENNFLNNYPAGEVTTFQGQNSINVTHARRVKITGNTGARVRSVAYVSNSKLVSVENNTADLVASYPVYLLDCSVTGIKGNQFTNGAARSIVSGGSDHVVTGNTAAQIASTGALSGMVWDFQDVTRLTCTTNIMQKASSLADAITVGGASSQVAVKHNTIIGFANAVAVAGSASAVVESNIIT